MNIFEPIIAFLAAQTAGEAEAEWPKGPTGPLYRTVHGMPMATYIGHLRSLENSLALQGAHVKVIAQRLRRLYFSTHSYARKDSATCKIADLMIEPCTPLRDPPITTDHVSKADLDALWGCASVRTARGLDVDVSHIWMLVDLKLNGANSLIATPAQIIIDSEYPALLGWAGDLGSALNAYCDDLLGTGAITPAMRRQSMGRAVGMCASKADLLGDLDAVVIADEVHKRQSTKRLSDILQEYYADDATPQPQALALAKPVSARRFHYFLHNTDSFLLAQRTALVNNDLVEYSIPNRPAIGQQITNRVEDAADDMLGLKPNDWIASASGRVDIVGRAVADDLHDKFLDFLITGLATGDAPWPPTNWI